MQYMARIKAMFKPNYTITHEILNNLMRTAEAKALIDNAYLIQKWEVALRGEAPGTSSTKVGE
jgi:hypothetical protein